MSRAVRLALVATVAVATSALVSGHFPAVAEQDPRVYATVTFDVPSKLQLPESGCLPGSFAFTVNSNAKTYYTDATGFRGVARLDLGTTMVSWHDTGYSFSNNPYYSMDLLNSPIHLRRPDYQSGTGVCWPGTYVFDVVGEVVTRRITDQSWAWETLAQVKASRQVVVAAPPQQPSPSGSPQGAVGDKKTKLAPKKCASKRWALAHKGRCFGKLIQVRADRPAKCSRLKWAVAHQDRCFLRR